MLLRTPAWMLAAMLYALIVLSGTVLASKDKTVSASDQWTTLTKEMNEELKGNKFKLPVKFVQDREKRYEAAIAQADRELADLEKARDVIDKVNAGRKKLTAKLDALTNALNSLPPQLQKSREQAINAAVVFIYFGETPSVPNPNERARAAKILSTFPGMLEAAKEVVSEIDELRKLRARNEYGDLDVAANTCIMARAAYRLAWQFTGDSKKADEVNRSWRYKNRSWEGNPRWNPPAS
jgi:septal ring factor EnvC (AmiA/AmiB activator)